MKCTLFSWQESEQLLYMLSRKIKDDDYYPDVIIGISRGGVIPARLLCDHFQMRDMLIMKAEHWGVPGQITSEAKITGGISDDITGKNVLLVDDLTDTGESLQKSVEYVKSLNPLDVRTAVIHHKAESQFKPDYYADSLDVWSWIIYPWEIIEDTSSFILKILDTKKMTVDIIKELNQQYSIHLVSDKLFSILRALEKNKKIMQCLHGYHVYWVKL